MDHLVSTAELPYPDGWFAVAFEHEVPPGRVIRRRLAGEDIVVYRTQQGELRVVAPYCPHLGAHLGYGGTVSGEDIVCPFHHFAFGPDGTCVRTGYGTRPPKMRLQAYECRDRNGTIMVWRHANGLGPQWELPELRDESFPQPIRKLTLLPAYPQDINENAFDSGHFPTLHGYRSAISTACSFEGVRSTSSMITERCFPLLGALRFPLETEGYGVGFTHIRAGIPQIRAEADTYFFSTPLEPRLMELRVLASLRLGTGRGSQPGAASITSALSWLLTRTLGPSMRTDLNADMPVWSNKAYVDRPRLAEGDGPITRYRRWARQFYSVPSGPDRPAVTADLSRPGRSRVPEHN